MPFGNTVELIHFNFQVTPNLSESQGWANLILIL